MKKENIILLIGIIILAIYFIVGIVLGIISSSMCKKECDKLNALEFEIYPSGNFALDDLCVCIFSDKIKAFRMG